MKPLFALLALALSCLAAEAATFEGRRGMSLDLWDTWPAESAWGDEKAMLPFPQWRRYISKPELEALKKNGLDFVRVPIDPAPFLSEASAALHDRLAEEIPAAVDAVLDAGLSVIVDIHPIPAGDRSVGTSSILEDQAMFDAYVSLLRRIAGSLKSKDASRVALELFNEPTNDCDSDGTSNWPGQMKQVFAAARASATKLTLVLSGACWGGAEGLAKINPKDIPDDNIIWSFHSYDPFILTHQGASWAGDFMPYVYGLPFPTYGARQADFSAASDQIRARIGSDAPKAKRAGHLAYFDEEIARIASKEGLEAAMEKPFAVVADWAKTNGIDPSDILLGEFGMIRQEYGNPHVVPAKDREAFYTAQIKRAEGYGFRWAAFSYSGAFGLLRGWDGDEVEPVTLPKPD